MVYDSFQFFNELDILKLRMNVLKDVVDYFVISESTVTFSGDPKPLYYNENKETVLLDKILQYADAATLRSYLHTLMNEQLSKMTINKQKFLRFGRLLPMLGANMDDNTARGLITHFVKPVSKDVDCAAVIVEYKDFYLDILRKDTTIAEPIVKEMMAVDGYAKIAEDLKSVIA